MSYFRFDSFADFLAMGGYAFYVWSVYLIFLVFLLVNLIFPILTRRRIIKQHRAKLLRELGN